MKADFFQVDCRPTESLYATAVRYRPDIAQPPDGVTLILAHGIGTHKETWQPLLRHLFSLAESSSGPRILEAWSIDCPNHGESAVVNEASLKQNYLEFPWNGLIYPRVILAFLQSQPDGVDFSTRNLVLAGHSNGGNAMVLLDSIQHTFTIKGYILVDALIGQESPTLDHMTRVVLQIIWNKRDTWPNRGTAKRELSKQPGYRNWDAEALDLYVKYGLRDHFAAGLPQPYRFQGGVTLACTRTAEAACHCERAHIVQGWKHLHQLYREHREVHIIHSKRDEFDSEAFKRSQVAPDPLSGCGPKTVQILEKGGHMFVQTTPEIAARAMHNALCSIEIFQLSSSTNPAVPCKLPAHL